MIIIVLILISTGGLFWIRRLGSTPNRKNFVAHAAAWLFALIPLSVLFPLLLAAFGIFAMMGDHWPSDFFITVEICALIFAAIGIYFFRFCGNKLDEVQRAKFRLPGIVLIALGAPILLMKVLSFIYFNWIGIYRPCSARYFEVIPWSDECSDNFKLPDFTFELTDLTPDMQEGHWGVCSHYSIQSVDGNQTVEYCDNGEGEQSAPTFKVGSVEYLADLAFEGCVDGHPAKGTVFVRLPYSSGGLKKFLPGEPRTCD